MLRHSGLLPRALLSQGAQRDTEKHEQQAGDAADGTAQAVPQEVVKHRVGCQADACRIGRVMELNV